MRSAATYHPLSGKPRNVGQKGVGNASSKGVIGLFILSHFLVSRLLKKEGLEQTYYFISDLVRSILLAQLRRSQATYYVTLNRKQT